MAYDDDYASLQEDLYIELCEELAWNPDALDGVRNERVYFRHGDGWNDEDFISTDDTRFIEIYQAMNDLSEDARDIMKHVLAKRLISEEQLQAAQQKAASAKSAKAESQQYHYQNMYVKMLRSEPGLSKRSAAIKIRKYLVEQTTVKRIPSDETIRKQLKMPGG